MILSGEKKEEYREIKPYWIRRLVGNYHQYNSSSAFYRGDYIMPFGVSKIRFRNGYAKDAREFTVEWKSLEVKCPKFSWCPKNTDLSKFVFCLNLGEIISSKNLS